MKRIFYTLLLAFFVLSSASYAQKKLVYVLSNQENEQPVLDAIDANGGYTVEILAFAPIAEDLPLLNSADVVILGRSVNSGDVDHDIMDQVTAPVLYSSPWVVRGDRAGMVSVEGADNVVDDLNAIVQADILDAASPIFEGISGTTVDLWTGPHSILRAETGTINGKILAQTADGRIVISTYDANVAMMEGGRTPAGPRAYYGLGQDNLTDNVTYFNYSDDGKAIYFNLLAQLAGGATATNKISAAQAKLKVYATTNMVSISMIDLNRIEVYSLDGKMMLSSNANSNQLELSASLNNGIYIVRAFNSKGTNATQKFIVR